MDDRGDFEWVEVFEVFGEDEQLSERIELQPQHRGVADLIAGIKLLNTTTNGLKSCHKITTSTDLFVKIKHYAPSC